MDRFDALRVFLTVVETGGFAAAARQMRRSPPSVTRSIAALESHLGARLLSRTTRVVRLTETGRVFATESRRILEALDDAEAAAAGAHRALGGTVRLTASVMFGQRYVAPALLDLLEQHPALSASLLLADHVVDLAQEGVDLAVRLAPSPPASAVATQVGQVRRVVCASPEYLRRHGRPRRVKDLEAHRLVAFHAGLGEPDWTFWSGGKRSVHEPNVALVVNSTEVVLEAALRGRALGRLLSYMVAPHVREERLEVLLEAHEPPPLPVYVIGREGRRAVPRVKVVAEFLSQRLREVLAPGGAAHLAARGASRRPSGERAGARR